MVGACDGCSIRLAYEILIDEPIEYLSAAAMHSRPLDQVNAAEAARIAKRRRLSMSRKVTPMRTAIVKEKGAT